MAHIDTVYNKLVKAILNDGFTYQDKSRNNITLLQIPTYTLDIDMQQGFPLITTKRISWKTIFHELIWMLSGSTSIQYLQDNGVKIWDKDAANFKKGANDFVGRIYGAQWRGFNGEADIDAWDKSIYIDQIKNLITSLKEDFYNRRHIVTAWNPAELDQMALPPCHWSFEIIPCLGGFMLKWHQRSCDTFLGIPFDIALYATLGKLIELEIGKTFMRLVGDLSNVHFYAPHINLAAQQITREPFNHKTRLVLYPSTNLFNLKISDLEIIYYESHPAIKAELYSKTT